MKKQALVVLTRRKLLAGIATGVAVTAFTPLGATIFDRLVVRDGWLLPESDLA